MGVGSVAELAEGWAALGSRTDSFLSQHGGGCGHGPSPLRAGFGALRFANGPIPGHCSYYAKGSESVRNIARICLGRYGEVSFAGKVGQHVLLDSSQVREAA